MQIRELYHGTNGDSILRIIRDGLLRPNADGKIYFSEQRFDSVLMHGADTKRKVAFAVKLRVTIPVTAALQQAATAGVPDTLIVSTAMPLQVQVPELYVGEGPPTRCRRMQENKSQRTAVPISGSRRFAALTVSGAHSPRGAGDFSESLDSGDKAASELKLAWAGETACPTWARAPLRYGEQKANIGGCLS